MKRLLVMMLVLFNMQTAYASDTVKIKMNISGAKQDNSYFLCLEGVGCLSILAANKGKTYPIVHPIEINNVYVMDVDSNYRVSNQGLPNTCNVTVPTNHTLTINGTLTPSPNGTTKITHLQCQVT